MDEQKIPVCVGSGYSGNTKRGFISLTIGDHKAHTMSTDEARRIAGLLLECAEASDQEHFLMSFAQGRIGVKEGQAGRLLLEFREWRERQWAAEGGHGTADKGDV